MVLRSPQELARLYEADETAWLDRTADLIRIGRFDQIDPASLSEFLRDMAKRDRREVVSRLVVLLIHLLKWDHQPDRRSGSWLATILEQQRELRQLLESGVLRNHAVEQFAVAYADAVKQASAETELPRSTFLEECPWDLDGAIADRGEDV